ncbi:unnamed protein product [Gongylonema pulchrum]|uniref:GLOBIN domain-containing protein n=1 Tax=Gongylonema pulchrum TaxID=637853 RepID=A0A183EXS9_9BILA|nr:unnamed protein product [Gongylonema pulchrum]
MDFSNDDRDEMLEQIRDSIGNADYQKGVPHLAGVITPFTAKNPQAIFRSFLKQLNELATALGYRARDLCKILPLLLKVLAKAKCDNLPRLIKSDWRTLVTELSQLYSSPACKATAQHQLNIIEQGDKERLCF